MAIYFSKNSKYGFSNSDLIKEKENKKVNLGSKVVYISQEDLELTSKEHKIPLAKAGELEASVGDKFFLALNEKKKNLNELGGRFFALLNGTSQGYRVWYSGKISEIEEELIIEERDQDGPKDPNSN